MTPKALRKVKKKHKLYKRYLHTKHGEDYQKYILERNECSKLLKKERKDHEKQIANNCKHDVKSFWKYVQERSKVNTGVSSLKDSSGKILVTDQEKAEALNNFFSSVFTKEFMDNMPNLQPGEWSPAYLADIVAISMNTFYR
jgi:hypothetical protein